MKAQKRTRAATLRRYATAKHSPELTDTLVEYSKRNPDEDQTIRDAQWRIQASLAQEKSVKVTFLRVMNRLLGHPWFVNQPTTILDHLVLGNQDDAANREYLMSAGITHICNCAAQVPNHFEGEFLYLKLHLHDHTTQELTPHFQTIAKFLRRVECLRGRVLIHCIAGVSRSPALVIAYLMIDRRMRLVDAYKLVRMKRLGVQPNQAFRMIN